MISAKNNNYYFVFLIYYIIITQCLLQHKLVVPFISIKFLDSPRHLLRHVEDFIDIVADITSFDALYNLVDVAVNLLFGFHRFQIQTVVE